MKKLIYPMFAFATLAMTSTSCSDEIENGAVNSNEAVVSFKVQLENEVGSRAIGDADYAKYFTFAVFKAEEGKIGDEVESLRQYDLEIKDKKGNVTTRLVKGQEYNFVFWAQSEAVKDKDGKGTYYDIKDMANIKVIYGDGNKIVGNEEKRDAFYAVVKDLTVTGPITETITLKRPFGQVNVGTSEGSLADAKTAEVNITQTKMVVSEVATELNVYSGVVAGIINNVEFIMASIPEKVQDVDQNGKDDDGDLKDVGGYGQHYEYLSMNYILVPDKNPGDNNSEDGSKKHMMNKVTVSLYDDNNIEVNTFDIPNVPVQRNWRTNIVGDIMNNNVTFNIVVDPSFNQDWEGDHFDDHNYYANVLTEEELRQAIAHGAVVTLKSNIDVTQPITVDKDIILNLDGKTLNITMDDILFRVNGSLEINGQDGTIMGNDYVASVNAGGTLTVNGGNYEVDDVTLFQANGGKVYINNGIFNAMGEYDGKKYTLNHIDTEKNNGLIEVAGGLFIGYDPANSASENPAMNFLAAGKETVNVGGNYIVRNVGETIVLPVDITTTTATVIAAGETFDGNGKTLRMEQNSENGYIKPVGGTVKNVNIEGYNQRNADGKVLYGIYILDATEDVLVENVTVAGVAYPLNATGATVDGLKLTVKNSTLYGWTSYAVFSSAEFIDVNFKKSGFEFGGTPAPAWFACLKPYCATTLTNCTFDEGFVLDLSALAANAKVKFDNCKVGDVVIAEDNIEALLGIAYDATKIEF